MIHPRRLKGTPANIARYYTIGDYYTKGGNEPSEWGGKLAPSLGLSGPVDPKQFEELLGGKVGDQQLGRRRKEGIQHHPGWDFTISAPKSISILALVTGEERILAAHERAVGVALAYAEEHAELRRRVEGEIVHETTGRLLFARFTEHASREGDPHLHTHVVVLNMTNHLNGDRMSSLETRSMYAEQIVMGQIYRNEIARDVREMGHEIIFDPRKGLFEVEGIPGQLIHDYSQRAEQINAHAAEHGYEGQAMRRVSFFATRKPKERVGLDELHGQWQARAEPYREDLDKLLAAARERGEQTIETDPRVARRAALFGIRQSETREAVNNIGRLYRTALASHVGEVRFGDMRPLFETQEAKGKLFVTVRQTGDQPLPRGRTSRRTAKLELALSEHISLAMRDAAPAASRERLAEVAAAQGLNAEQTTALIAIGSGTNRAVGVHGAGGVGKSTLVRALVEATSDDHITVALAPTSSAAAELGRKAGIESRTLASLLASGGHGLTDRHILVVDEAGQLGNRQAIRVLEISRATGARLIFLGDNKQTGAIEQGKAYWLLQQLGLPTSQLKEAMRQKTGSTQEAADLARKGDYAASLAALDRVTTGASAEELAKTMVAEWTRLKPEMRADTNILVLDNATRLTVNSHIREVLRREGTVAAEEHRLEVLTPAGMTDQEKQMARFYREGQVLKFSRDNQGLGIARDADYRVVGIGRNNHGRQVVRLADEHGRIIEWRPGLGKAAHVNVFLTEDRQIAQGDRIQWRLLNKEIDVKNAERGTVLALDGHIATIKWDRGERVQQVDLSVHRTWDHGYAETVYSAQSKTYTRVYALAPVESGLVNGQNYYTAITRAAYGVKLWTEDQKHLAEKLASRSGEKTSSLEGLGRIKADSHKIRGARHKDRHDRSREANARERDARKAEREQRERELQERADRPLGFAETLAGRAQGAASLVDSFLRGTIERDRAHAAPAPDHAGAPEPVHQPEPQPQHDHGGHGGGRDR
ncbi:MULTISPECIES: MobF family relaxase [Sphingobium]|uniref:TrwC protein n=1 Tax=Sphingobium baderi LL03 TaxID=1114964 RepID=T0GVS5_9SPHN|nr:MULTISPECIES: MobF family relaxase [Sphingobium]EQB04048.1 TrwC protein [Sphingobium baderi LL03]KMS63163.1 TrwC protein [Sphingobium baderi LL03]MDX3910654.1 MobF family relaxase [Sphingobium sp.]